MKKATIKQLRERLLDQGNVKNLATNKITMALSISDHRHRAHVSFFQADSLKAVWEPIEQRLLATAQGDWVRIESVYAQQKLPREQFVQQLKKLPRMNYWRRGISFDPHFETALLEMEINGHEFFKPSKDHKIGKNASGSSFDAAKLTRYLTKRNGQSLSIDVEKAPDIWTFETVGIFSDGTTIYDLSTAETTRGIRRLTNKKQDLKTYIAAGERFLARQIQTDGKFIYGYFPAKQQILSNYNSVRHFSSVYALLEAIAFTGRREDLPQAKQAITWGLEHLTFKQNGALFIGEQLKSGERELKLGAQAMVILCLCKYQEVTGDETFLADAKLAFAGVQAFIGDDHHFNHVLNADLSVKDAFRIIYYEGEVTFAMARLYELTQDQQVLTVIKQSLDYMVAHDYGRYRDHWISYAVNEALEILPANRNYMQMGLKNVYGHLTFIEQRDTSYPTLLELLNASVKMTTTIQATGNGDLLEPYDLARLVHARRYRAEHEFLTGSFQPELAMYFYYPEKFYGGFFARHDHFRTRIDDCEHFLSGLIGYYQDTYSYGK